jgi:hypothetical protein
MSTYCALINSFNNQETWEMHLIPFDSDIEFVNETICVTPLCSEKTDR